MADLHDNAFGPHLRTNDPQFSATLNEMALICMQMQQFLDLQNDDNVDVEGRMAPLIETQARMRLWFAELDSRGSADGWYVGHEVVFEDSAGDWATKTGGRIWDADSSSGVTHLDELFELEGCATCPLGSIVVVRQMYDDDGNIMWWFRQPANCAAVSTSTP